MDGGPFRTGRSADRRATPSRPEPANRQQREREPEAEEPKPVRQATAAQRSHPAADLKPIIAIVVLVVLLVAGWFAFSKMKAVNIGIDSSKYQAVFFENGQIYFGKLQHINSDYLKLTDIYYLDSAASSAGASSQQEEDTPAQSNNVQLIKLGSEIHGPEDAMIINRDQLLYFENLKDDGKVVTTIEADKKK